MKSIKNNAVKSMLAKQIDLMINAGDLAELQKYYDKVQTALKDYYNICKSVAEYNELLKTFDNEIRVEFAEPDLGAR